VAQLLVSVQSAAEALHALEGGAAIIDVKEPRQGPLGRAPESIWREVQSVVGARAPVSVALGELSEWTSGRSDTFSAAWTGIAYRKIGLAGSGDSWRSDWRSLRVRWGRGRGPGWIAVAYADWQRAGAPSPDEVLDEAIGSTEIVGVLVDTWDKSYRWTVDAAWAAWAGRVRDAGKRLALAGGIDLSRIGSLEAMRPDIVAVRGAACSGGDRLGDIDPIRVQRLARVVGSLEFHDREAPEPSQ
jgi:uncharacterized protein (UPF0264 family)